MADETIPPLSDLLQELAEGLQSAGTYLSAARRISSHNASENTSIAEIIDKAASELMRAQTAFHRLRDHLLSGRRYEKRDAATAPVQTGALLPAIGRETSDSHVADSFTSGKSAIGSDFQKS